ncbi:MAG TPA: tetratricopeptide repeat protein [Blastocatellia bacterium]|nr:tetratricopeptide repeat protein [Blastocatellia bacterium]
MAMSDVLYRLIGRRSPNCPNEAEILAYSENKLSRTSYARFERHFAECEDCRESLAFVGRGLDHGGAQPSEALVSTQTERVLNYIRIDEINRSARKGAARAWPGFQISYARLATVGLVICAIVAAGVYVIMPKQSAAGAGMEAFKLAVRDNRRIPERVSGGLSYSPYSITRGDDRLGDDLYFDRALAKLTTAEQENAPAEDRLVLARVYLARGRIGDFRRALEILRQLAARGVETPEALNDTGVAHLELGQYDEATAYFTRALAKAPAYDEALFNRALSEQGAGRNDNARRDWQQFIDQSKDEKWKAEGRVHLKDLDAAGSR